MESKIEIKELRIGNIIRYRDERDTIVSSLGDNFNTSHINKSYYVGSDCLEEYEPIPLTKEWLLKFGFDYVRNTNEYHNRLINEGAYYLKPVGDAFNHWYLYHKKKMITTNIMYVHQLQNLYFALTNKELNYVQK